MPKKKEASNWTRKGSKMTPLKASPVPVRNTKLEQNRNLIGFERVEASDNGGRIIWTKAPEKRPLNIYDLGDPPDITAIISFESFTRKIILSFFHRSMLLLSDW